MVALALCRRTPRPRRRRPPTATSKAPSATAPAAALPGVTVTVTNIETGTSRTVVTNEDGGYRAPLLPLGSYKVSAELQGFKTLRAAGHHAVGRPDRADQRRAEVGNVTETITVTERVADRRSRARSTSAAPSARARCSNLPLVSRNPYNFAFLQANVTGYENNEFGVPRINANGSQMRTNYQIDGNTNTEKDRAGLRLLPVSEVMVREVKVVTNGFAPEFGQTTGMVYNAITPSGTNDLPRLGQLPFRRNAMSARPFFLAPTAPQARHQVNDVTATLGGPIVKDKCALLRRLRVRRRSLSPAAR